MKRSLCYVHSSFFLAFTSCSCVIAFIPPSCRCNLQKRLSRAPFSRCARKGDNNFSDELLQASTALLPWEVIEARESKPVLNLSTINTNENLMKSNDLQPITTMGESDETDFSSTCSQWNATRSRLQELGIISCKYDEDKLLEFVPQLLRLDTAMVVESCQAALALFDNNTSAILQEPRLLSFRDDDLRYGIEFLSVMMACSQDKVLETCRSSPALLVAGAEGGLQEQAVKRALGAASSATHDANKCIVSDAAASLGALKRRQKRKGM